MTMIAATLIATLGGPAFATADGCAIVRPTPDGYLSVRSGPSQAHPEIFRLPSGQTIWIDDKPDGANNKWWHVNGVVMPDGRDTLVDGWAYGLYLRPSNCPDEGASK
jgi:hypothetical protein